MSVNFQIKLQNLSFFGLGLSQMIEISQEINQVLDFTENAMSLPNIYLDFAKKTNSINNNKELQR